MNKEIKGVYTINNYLKAPRISKEFITLESFYLCWKPKVRCRNLDDKVYTLTVKYSCGFEHTMEISREDYYEYMKDRITKIMRKERHDITIEGQPAIFDYYLGDIDACIVNIEFSSEEEKDNFVVPDYLTDMHGDFLTREQLQLHPPTLLERTIKFLGRWLQ